MDEFDIEGEIIEHGQKIFYGRNEIFICALIEGHPETFKEMPRHQAKAEGIEPKDLARTLRHRAKAIFEKEVGDLEKLEAIERHFREAKIIMSDLSEEALTKLCMRFYTSPRDTMPMVIKRIAMIAREATEQVRKGGLINEPRG